MAALRLPSPRGLGSAIATTASIWSSILGQGVGGRAGGGSRQQIRGLLALEGRGAGEPATSRGVHALRSGGGGVSQLEKKAANRSESSSDGWLPAGISIPGSETQPMQPDIFLFDRSERCAGQDLIQI